MKLLTYSLPAFAACAILMASCDEDVSKIGSSLTDNETTIIVDSIYADLKAHSDFNNDVNTRETIKLLGKFQADQYGSISCGFVSQLLCSAKLGLPDSITANHIDSLNYIFQATRGGFTGDSLAPQKLTLYNLTKQLPSGITSSFDASGHYDRRRPAASRPYTLSAIAENDTLLLKGKVISINVPLPRQSAVDLFNQYSATPDLFAWPQNFAKQFPGIAVEPTFGNGCLATLNGFRAYLYYHYSREKSVYKDGEYVTTVETVKDSTAVFSSAPEVLSATTVKYTPSESLKALVAEGKSILTTPTGYRVNFSFPAGQVLDSYIDSSHRLAVVSNLSMQIPAAALKNDYGLGVAPYLLMVKRSEAQDFFAQNKVPDNRTSFYAAYSADKQCYTFSSMRAYMLDLLEKGGDFTADDTDFVLIPVSITTEEYTDPDTYKTQTVTTRCAPYIEKPTLTLLDTDKALICFTYTLQSIK